MGLIAMIIDHADLAIRLTGLIHEHQDSRVVSPGRARGQDHHTIGQAAFEYSVMPFSSYV
jgi:hypothetical protein